MKGGLASPPESRYNSPAIGVGSSSALRLPDPLFVKPQDLRISADNFSNQFLPHERDALSKRLIDHFHLSASNVEQKGVDDDKGHADDRVDDDEGYADDASGVDDNDIFANPSDLRILAENFSNHLLPNERDVFSKMLIDRFHLSAEPSDVEQAWVHDDKGHADDAVDDDEVHAVDARGVVDDDEGHDDDDEGHDKDDEGHDHDDEGHDKDDEGHDKDDEGQDDYWDDGEGRADNEVNDEEGNDYDRDDGKGRTDNEVDDDEGHDDDVAQNLADNIHILSEKTGVDDFTDQLVRCYNGLDSSQDSKIVVESRKSPSVSSLEANDNDAQIRARLEKSLVGLDIESDSSLSDVSEDEDEDDPMTGVDELKKSTDDVDLDGEHVRVEVIETLSDSSGDEDEDDPMSGGEGMNVVESKKPSVVSTDDVDGGGGSSGDEEKGDATDGFVKWRTSSAVISDDDDGDDDSNAGDEEEGESMTGVVDGDQKSLEWKQLPLVHPSAPFLPRRSSRIVELVSQPTSEPTMVHPSAPFSPRRSSRIVQLVSQHTSEPSTTRPRLVARKRMQLLSKNGVPSQDEVFANVSV